MALRVAGPKGPAPIEEDIKAVEEQAAPPVPEETLPEEAPLPEEEPLPEEGLGVVNPLIAGYRGPEEGPFACKNCQHFMQGSCEVVSGPIDPDGLCNMFDKGAAPEGMDEDIPEPLPEDMPLPQEEEAPPPTEEE